MFVVLTADMNTRIISIFFANFFLSCFYSYAQDSSAKTFVRFNSYIGYVIDSTENAKCKCIPFAGGKLRYGSLVQLPDSSLIFRMMLTDKQGIYSVPMSKMDVERLASRTPLINEKISDEEKEKSYLMHLAGDSASYHLIDYFNLKYKAVESAVPVKELRDSSYNYFYFNIGIGITNRAGMETYFSYAGDLGFVYKKHIISTRVWHSRFLNSQWVTMTPKERITEFGLLYGRLFPVDRLAFTVNAGISYSKGILRGKMISSWSNGWFDDHEEYESLDFNEAGIPLKVEMLLGSRRRSLASFAMYADLNARYSYFGFIVSLRPNSEYRPLKPEHYPKKKN